MPRRKSSNRPRKKRAPNRRSGPLRRAALRIYALHRAFRKGVHLNCTDAARLFKVTRKTILRDIAFMRETLGLPLKYEDQFEGYYYSADVPKELDFFEDYPDLKEDLRNMFEEILLDLSRKQIRLAETPPAWERMIEQSMFGTAGLDIEGMK